jgi:protein-tyrosine phosphatase
VIDLHCHVLPGIDDGPRTIEDSVALARDAANLGMRTLVATPHVSPRYPNDGETISRLVEELVLRLATEEVPLEIRSGAEIAPRRLPEIEPDELARLCLGGGPWLLVESPLHLPAPNLGPMVLGLQQQGFRILLAHPERCPAFLNDPAELAALVKRGVLTSITAGAFAGRFGGRVRKFAFELVNAGMVHTVASDAHDRSHRPPGLASELRQAGLERVADWLTREVPQAILDGTDLPHLPLEGWTDGDGARRAWWRRVARR